jgi:hypothetical protein
VSKKSDGLKHWSVSGRGGRTDFSRCFYASL